MDNVDEQLRNKLLQMIPSGVGVFDLTDGVIHVEYLNDGYYQMIHASRTQRTHFQGVSFIEAVYEDDREGLLHTVQASLTQKRQIVHYRCRVLTGNGTYMWLAVRANHEQLDEHTERFFTSYYDIDELIRTQDKLRYNEILLNEFVKFSDVFHFTYYPGDHRYETIMIPDSRNHGSAFRDHFPEDFIHMAQMSSEDADKYNAMIYRIDQGEQEAKCSIQATLNGNKGWYSIHLWNLLDENGRPLRAIGSVIDISRFKEAEIAFMAERRKMKALQGELLAVSCFNVTKDRNMEINNDTDLSYEKPVNDEIYRSAVHENRELSNQNRETLDILMAAAENIPDEEERRYFIRTCSHEGMMNNYAEGRHEITLEYRRKTGRGLLWVSTRVVLLQDPSTGDVLAFYYTSDINDRVIYRKITGHVLHQNYESVAYYNVNNGRMYIKSPDNYESVRFAEHDYAEAVDAAIEKYVTPDEKMELRKKYEIENIISNLMASGSYSIFYTGSEKDRSIPGYPRKRMKCDIFYLDEKRDIIVFLHSNMTDIYEHEREVREKMAQAMHALEMANNAKTEFVSRISHDIRTPISIISSITDFAYEDIHDEKKLRNDLDKIRSANVFLLSLINDVLDISKIDSGKIQLNPEPYTYEEHSANIRNIIETMCEEKGLKCYISARQNHGIIVADKTRINQIILNLISNAVKYTPPGGTVSYISCSKDLADNKVLYSFEIKDTGIGMSREFQAHMFDPFSQEYSNPDRPKGSTGTGLGLSIVKKIVDMMGGTLEVESELGKGTTVRCSIVFPDAARDPAYENFAEKEAEDRKAADVKLSGHILLAEDNPVNTEIAVRILNHFGVTVDCAENGRIAADMFAKSEPGYYHAILMDIQMPVMNGYESTRIIRAMRRPDAAQIPILAMTADAFADAMQKGRDAGMTEYLVKPIDTVKLRQALGKAFQSW